ncbi:MAG: fibronectin type III domain-containing protein [Chitinispirillaceae bacterium]|nr:fibronectin type III domain-containing protein [Chitinispirillaceae bacterium]
MRETSRGTIVCAAGDEYPDNGGSALNNYAAYLELDSAGTLFRRGEWNNTYTPAIGGFSVLEVGTANYMFAGNRALYYTDTNGNDVWQHRYTFSLSGVGTVVNNVNRVKMLRDGRIIVAGQAYEGNCWTDYGRLYYDAWWSPISAASGTNTAWDTAGAQGGSDALYDFTQLVNGNIVFTGTKGTTSDSGMWVFVTDSTGANLLWEKQFNIGYRSNAGTNLRPLSVCATPDTGFTVVGEHNCPDSLGGVNAFAVHFMFKTAAPTLVSPANLATNRPVSLPLIWNRVTSASGYDYQVSTNSGFTAIFTEDSLLTDSTVVISGLANATNYYWRVRARGAYGTSAWSVYRRFTTIVAAPATPTLVSPSDGATDQLAPVTVVWSSVTGATSYHVQVSTDSTFATFFLRDSTLTGTQRVVSGLANGTTYYWRVRAKNTGGVSAWSTVWDFTTSTPPGTPTLVSPANGATNQPVSITFVWTTATNAATYHLQVALDIGFTSIFSQDSTLTDTQSVVSSLSNATNYYWRVRAKTGGGIIGNWASYRSLTTIVTLPGQVVILSPLDSAVIDVDSVRLRWNRALPSVDRYLVEVATDTNMTNLVVNDSSVTDTSRLITSLVNNTTYYWRVKAHNAAGWGSYSTETRFVTLFTGVLYNGSAIRAFSLRYSSGTLHYTLPARSFVSVTYYDVRGRMVGSYVNQTQGAGRHTLSLPIASFTTGAYVQVFEAGSTIRKDRIMVVK